MTIDAERMRSKFKDIIQDLLLPLFPGARFGDPIWATPRKKKSTNLVVIRDSSNSKLKVTHPENSSLICNIERVQPFSEQEKRIVTSFLKCMPRLERDYEEPYQKDISASVMSELVSKSISNFDSDLILKILSTLSDWSQQTYEGQRIAFSIGIVNTRNGDRVLPFSDIENEDFTKVLSNGQDTMLIIDKDGFLVKHRRLINDKESDKLYAPVRFCSLAKWTEDNNKLAIALTRNGEIVIFNNGELCFAKRRGLWRYFSHNSVIKIFTSSGLGRKSSELFRKEIYLTALDISFARTGGCIGIVTKSNIQKMREAKLINDSDMLASDKASIKTQAVQKLIKDAKFQELDRLHRMELVSIDGAIVLDHSGRILTCGAILGVKGGSSSGGRQAATEAIAKYGLGIKISNDGYIKVFNRKGEEIARLS
ncbi:hypothetical protein [Desulfolutivibrio sulfoxidireducens]|uniref:hypothetical protein n=1 Tax=Desulfolutivibrio sulfoxidireducens TaxID=2773299 RepID=UPI00159EB2E9|nr:hypothetical protein [Desulfolutivibrio sulfoxidireducens]QLA20902.1 hypothetical protein GD604_14840 [Desulfolutivibrio sulfoxidireducens]